MASFGIAPRIWGFALEGSVDAVCQQFTELTKDEGRLDWVLIPIPGNRLDQLRIPEGFVMQTPS
jgi:hypothetical protein